MKNKISILLFFILLIIGISDLSGQRLSRDQNVDILVNQLGYTPNAGKTLVTKGKRTGKFQVINTLTQEVIFSGKFKPSGGDFGDYSTGDFSTVIQEGKYYIKADTVRSFPFSISRNVYKPTMGLIVGYFALQRCGPSSTGYITPCHLDDGVRLDNGKHKDVTGGWHDASDLRKWVDATIYGMVGLAKTYELEGKESDKLEKILDELKWGNMYFLKMQEPDGFVMNFIGGGMNENNDNNRWTDNDIGPDGGELVQVTPDGGRSKQVMSVIGSKDDRVIQTRPVGIVGQYNFITSEAIMARLTSNGDPEYSKKCLLAATNCYNWCVRENRNLNAGALGASIQAAIEMYKTTKQDIYRDYAATQAALLRSLQVKDNTDGANGFFKTSSSNAEPFKQISNGCMEFISVCDLVKAFPTHKDVSVWKEMVSDYATKYATFMSQKNTFGIVPYGLFSKQDPGGNRRTGNYWYRYFMHPDLSWWVGVNANLASAGIGLMKAGNVLNDNSLKAIGQKQLDWIIGVNPFNSSTIISVGYNHPVRFTPGSFKPMTPEIPGAVMNGLGGDEDDQPDLIPQSNFQQSEYWTPMVAYTLWLMAEISKSE